VNVKSVVPSQKTVKLLSIMSLQVLDSGSEVFCLLYTDHFTSEPYYGPWCEEHSSALSTSDHEGAKELEFDLAGLKKESPWCFIVRCPDNLRVGLSHT
jgi:hypothetical protein